MFHAYFRKARTGLARGAAAIALVLGIAGSAGVGSNATAFADEPAPTRREQRQEVRYLMLVADHHAMGVMMAMMRSPPDRSALHARCAEHCEDELPGA